MRLLMAAGAACILSAAAPAAAQLVVEADGARADGHWGGEIGAGYSIALLPRLSLTPAAGVLVFAQDGGGSRTRVTGYGRVEAAYDIPLLAEVGVGARIGDQVRPYGTVALPVAPRLRLRADVGDDYYALGLRLRF